MRFTTTGDSFSPIIELAAGSNARVIWMDSSGVELEQGASPQIKFSSPGTRIITMATRFDDVLTVNLGFDAADDKGRHSLDARYNKTAEPLAHVTGLTRLPNLRRFLAAGGSLTGAIDLSGLSRLEHVECFGANVESVDLTGCTSLIRLCLEKNRLSELDLNPVSGTLRDLRAADQQTGSLSLAPLAAPLQLVYHFCVRDQVVTGHPTSVQLPVCEELLNWNSGQVGVFPTPGSAHAVLAAGNSYATADFDGKWEYPGGWGILDLTDNRLSSIGLSGCRALQTIRVGGNALDQIAIDRLLAEVSSWGTAGFHLILDGGNAAPSSAGMQDVADLRGRGWEVAVANPGFS